MPRGRAPGYDTQREQILARAAELFAHKGYSATSMSDVADACGISKPALYHYVRDKHELLAEIVEGHVGRLRALVAADAGVPVDPEARLRGLVARLLGAYADAQSEHRVLTEDVRFLEPAARRRVLDGEREVVRAFSEAIAAVRPDLRAAHLEKPLTMLLFGMMNWMFTWLRPDGRLTHADMAPIVADLLFGGLPAVGRAASRPAPERTRPAPRRVAASDPILTPSGDPR